MNLIEELIMRDQYVLYEDGCKRSSDRNESFDGDVCWSVTAKSYNELAHVDVSADFQLVDGNKVMNLSGLFVMRQMDSYDQKDLDDLDMLIEELHKYRDSVHKALGCLGTEETVEEST